MDNLKRHDSFLRAIIKTAPLDPFLAITGALDDKRRRGRVRGPLHGIPLLVVNHIATGACLAMPLPYRNKALRKCYRDRADERNRMQQCLQGFAKLE